MAKLNVEALKQVQEELINKTSKGGGLYFYYNKIEAETEVRLMPPAVELNGSYFFEQTVFWINKKPFVSRVSLNPNIPCVMEQELEIARELAKTDKTIKALLDDDQKFKKQSRYLIPILLLDVTLDASNRVTGVKVKDDAPKVLVTGANLLKSINKIVTSRQYQNGTDWGIMDPEIGHNLILSKAGKGLDTVYAAEAWTQASAFDKKYYAKTPNVIELTEKELESDTYLRGVIRNYFYGEPMPVKETAPTVNAAASVSNTAGAATNVTAPANAAGAVAMERRSAAPIDEAAPVANSRIGGKRDLMSDLNDD